MESHFLSSETRLGNRRGKAKMFNNCLPLVLCFTVSFIFELIAFDFAQFFTKPDLVFTSFVAVSVLHVTLNIFFIYAITYGSSQVQSAKV